MLQNFPLKRRFMTPTTQFSLSSQQLMKNSSVFSGQASGYSTLQIRNHRDQMKPILRNTSVTVKAQDAGKLLVNRFAELYTSLDSADVSIMCGRSHDTLKAHRFVLSGGSVYFQDALKVAQCKHPVVVVKNVSGEVMSWVLEYLYLGHVTLKSESDLQQFLNAAKYLHVFGVPNEKYSVTI